MWTLKWVQFKGIKNNRIFGVLLCMKFLEKGDPHWNDFVNNLSNLISHYSAVKKSTMGFPEGWETLLKAE